jgi:hypothetical protein
MMMVRQLTHTPAPPPICREIARRAARRVAFKNDHPDLMKPRATDKFIFEKNGIITNYVHEKQEPVVTRPRSRTLRFGRGRSLAEMAGEAPEKKARSLTVTMEEVDPERILRKKSPACPLYTPMTANSNGMKMWKQAKAKEISARLTTLEVTLAETNALNKATTDYYQLLRKRSKLIKGVYESPVGNRSSETAYKIEQITNKMAGLKKEMKIRRQNLQSMGAF